MPIVVFDIDGTLTDTTEVDVECYEAAVRSELGLEIPSDWQGFDDVTDATILAVACERSGIPVPAADVQQRVAERVGALLEVELRRAPRRFRPVPGVAEVLALLEGAGWRVAMATGAWRPSALVKLRGAGIPHEAVPLASASDHPERVEIIRHAVRALGEGDGEAVVYVGDGEWDGRAAQRLGYPFVGVGDGARRGRLLAAGASLVVSDFADPDPLLEALSQWRG